MSEFRVPECRCPACGKGLDAATNVLGKKGPDPGDATICLYCGRLAIFTADLRLRELTGKEMIEAMKDERIATIERARQEAMNATPKPSQ